LLARTDAVITNYNPDYVWISSSINDFFDGVTQEQYKARMQNIISKVQQSNAIAIVMDPAPGPPNQATDEGVTFTTLSQRYATQILDLLAEATE
jgi:lysophospholipase L1-like esterase